MFELENKPVQITNLYSTALYSDLIDSRHQYLLFLTAWGVGHAEGPFIAMSYCFDLGLIASTNSTVLRH